MRLAADYQLRIQAAGQGTEQADINYEWIRGAFYTGIPALYEAAGDPKYLQAAIDYSAGRNWQLDIPDTRHADWQCIGQLYLELYLKEADPARRDPAMIDAIRQNVDAQMAAPLPGRIDWWWCDALYMAPPVLVRLYAATGDARYLDYLDTMFWDAWEHLYDPAERLYFRDHNYFTTRTKQGHKVFWSRGNGWVLAGLARLLPYLPADHPTRPRYEQLFQDMADRIAGLQHDDGLWRTSLLDPEEFPAPETSGTAFFTFALAWGINAGLLERDRYEPVVIKGWQGLARCVTPEGKLGHVQTVAAAPGPTNPEDTREYATGALLLAGAELLKL